jgi:hypothetical protein
VLLLESWRYVVEWLNHHPNRHDPAAPLFLSRSRRNPGERLSGAAVYALVQRAEQRAGLQKGLTVKAFRPAAYGELVKNYSLPEPSLRQHFGWSARSAMPAWYNHLLPADYQQILLAKAGKLKPGAEPKPVLARVACRLCGDPNLPTDAVCRSCSCPLSPQAVAEHRERLRAEVSAEFQRQVDALVGRLPMDVLRRLIEEDLRKLPGWPDPGVAGNLDQVRMTVAANCPMCRVPAPHEHAAGEFFAFVSGPGMPPEVRAWLERQRPAKETA